MSTPTIGLLITDLTRTWTIQQWSGVRDAVQARGVNLVTFDGRHLRSPYGSDAQANILYQLAISERIDGLVVWTEGLVGYMTPPEVVAFLARYAPVPLVSAEHEVEGFPNILNDDFGAMRSVLCHLIEVHGYRRIAYVRHATPLHRAFEERYRAYRETLVEHGISFDPELVSPPIEAEAPPAAFILADWMRKARASEWDAIVAHNDLSAFHALRDLRSLGTSLTRAPAITGFDDSEEGAAMNPSLTTIHPPFRQMGRAAVELLLDLMEGKTTQKTRTLRGELVVRRSCGCPDRTATGISAASAQGGSLARAAGKRGKPSAGTAPPDLTGQIASGITMSKPWHRQLLEGLVAETRGTKGAFLRRLEESIQELAETDDGLQELGDWLSDLRASAVARIKGKPQRLAEDLFHQALVLVGEAAQRRQRRTALESLQREAALRNVEASLFSKFSVTNLMDELAFTLPGLGIPRCAVSLYEDPAPYAYPAQAPEHSRLALSFDPEGRLDLTSGNIRFPSRQLAPPQAWPSREPFDLVVEALYFQDRQLGFALFGVGPEQGAVYESLRAVISNDLQGAHLVEQEQRRVLQLRDSEQERRQLESMLHQAQKLEAVGQLASGVAHEFNNILTGIMGFSSILMMDMKPDDPHRDVVERILTGSRRAADLAQRMLILSQKNTARPTLIDLNETMRNSGTFLQTLLGEKIHFQFEPWEERVPVLADDARIHQVLVNLAENARDAMADGGTVRVRLSVEKIDSTGLAPPGVYARLWFSDTGSGMDELTQARLFEPFFTTKEIGKGTGLGLAIVWAIIEQHHGFITVTSKPAQGTAFEILFPLQQSGSQPAEPFERDASLKGSETILIADDDPAVREMVRSVLQSHGYVVVEAQDGEEAIRCFTEREGGVHLMLLDTLMAKLNGWEVAQEIRRRAPESRIIFMSEYAPSRFGDEPLRVNDRRLLLKPFSASQLVEKVRMALNG
jgi:signal transduction histidine kinase/DNA-binding LacI/PurR family transcriptional regulator